MTIQIAVAFPDFVLVMADGRLSSGSIWVSDNEQKVVQIAESAALSVGGSKPATDCVRTQLIQADATTAESLQQSLTTLSEEGMHAVKQAVSQGSIPTQALKCCLVAAGFDARGAYVVGVLRGDFEFSADMARAPNYILVGGDEEKLKVSLVPLLVEILAASAHSSSSAVDVIRACEATIKQAESHSIGGKICYWLKHRDHSPVIAFL